MSTMTCVVHHAVRRDLQAFAAAAQTTPVHDRQAWMALDARWQIFAEGFRQHLGAGSPDPRLVAVAPLLQACTDGFARAARGVDEDGRAALAVRLAALREWDRRSAIAPQAVTWSMPPVRALQAVPWTVCRLSREARESVLRAGGPVFRLVWLVARRGFERRDRAAFRYVAEG